MIKSFINWVKKLLTPKINTMSIDIQALRLYNSLMQQVATAARATGAFTEKYCTDMEDHAQAIYDQVGKILKTGIGDAPAPVPAAEAQPEATTPADTAAPAPAEPPAAPADLRRLVKYYPVRDGEFKGVEPRTAIVCANNADGTVDLHVFHNGPWGMVWRKNVPPSSATGSYFTETN